MALDLLPTADNYFLNELKASCDLRGGVSKDNVIRTAILSEVHDCPDMLRFCAPFFSRPTSIVFREEMNGPSLNLSIQICSLNCWCYAAS